MIEEVAEVVEQPIEEEVMTQQDRMALEIINLRAERDAAIDRAKHAEDLLLSSQLSPLSVEGNDEKCVSMTGLSWEVLLTTKNYLSGFHVGTAHSMAFFDQFFITLVKLRHNPTFLLLAHIRGISESGCILIFWRIVDLMYEKLSFLVSFQDRESIFQTIPTHIKEVYPRLTCIIDCFEVFIESPQNLQAKQQCYSNYKKHSTLKVLISCTASGAINFVSKCYGGRTSDVQIVRESGFIQPQYHQPGNQILGISILFLFH